LYTLFFRLLSGKLIVNTSHNIVIDSEKCIHVFMKMISYFLIHHHHHQPINDLTAGHKPFLWITHNNGQRDIAHHRHMIAEIKQRWSVMRWVTKILLSALACFGRHVKPLVWAAFVVVSTHQSAHKQSPYVLFIRKACAPGVGHL
jgi:hypothetical protein